MKIFKYRFGKEVSATFWFVVSTFVVRAVSLITTPLYTRLLTSEQYGMISNYNTWSGILSIIFTLSIASNAFNKGLIQFENKRKEFLSSVILLTACTTFVGFMTCTVFKDFLYTFSSLEYKYFVFIFVGLFLNVSVGFWNLCKKFDGQYYRVIAFNIVSTIIAVPMTYLVIKYVDCDKVLAKILLESLISYVWGAIYAIKSVIEAPKKVGWKCWKFALVFCIPLLPHYMANHLLNQSDRLMITYYSGAGDTAIYSVAYMASQIINICWTVVTGVYIPWLYKKMNSEEVSRVRNTSTMIAMLVLIVCVVVMLFAPEYMKVMAPENYSEGTYVVPIIMAGTFCLMVCQMWSNVELFFMEKNYVVTTATLVSALVNIVLNILMIPRLGYIAAAYTTLIGYLIMLAIHFVNVKQLKLQKYFDLKLDLFFVGLSVLISIIVQFFYHYFVIRILILFIIVLIGWRKKLYLKNMFIELKGDNNE